MTDTPRPQTMLLLALLLGGGSLVLARLAWLASPQLRVPPTVAYLAATVGFVGAVMIALQVAHQARYSDLLASLLLLAATAEFLWFTIGPGPRPCRIGFWQAPEPVCRGGLGTGTLGLAAMTLWAAARYWRRRGTTSGHIDESGPGGASTG